MSMLQLKNLSIGFETNLYSNINVQMEKGKVTALMGINGVGKSCFLKTLAGLHNAKSGEVFINEKSLESYSLNEKAKTIAIVTTEKIHIDYLTVEELAEMGRAPHTGRYSQLKDQDKLVIDSVLKELGLVDISKKYFSNLSDGQKQKALIARALAQRPDLLILDEPTTYLDIPSKIELMKTLKKIAREDDVAIVLSTHDWDLTEKFADELWLMGQDGKFLSGRPADLKSAGHIEKYFFKSERA